MIPDSEDTATQITNRIEPDWARGVTHFLTWKTDTTRSTGGIEQRTSRRATGRKAMEFFVDGMDQARAIDLLGTHEGWADGPLLVPWWPEGLRLSIDMVSVTEAQVEVEPFDWATVGDQILIGDEVREITNIVDRVVTLQALGGSTQKTAGTWVYPMRRAALDRPDAAVRMIRHDAAREVLRFVAF